MKLALYTGRTIAGAVLVALFSLVVLVVTVNLVERAGRLSDLEGSGAWVALRLALFSSVEYAYQVLPIACFLGFLVAGTQLARRGELLAIESCGIGPGPVWGGAIGLILLVVGIGIWLGEFAVPSALVKAERIEQRELGSGSSKLARFFNRRSPWIHDGNLALYLPSVDAGRSEFVAPVIYVFEQGLIGQVIEGEVLRHHDGGWWVHQAKVHSSQGSTIEHQTLSVPLSVRPDALVEVTGNPRHMNLPDIRHLIARRSQAGLDTGAHRVELHHRVAYPLLALWLVLLAAPWNLGPHRQRSLAATLGVGVAAIAVVLALTHVARLLALSRRIPAPLGAWGVGILCLVLLPLSWRWCRHYRQRGHLW